MRATQSGARRRAGVGLVVLGLALLALPLNAGAAAGDLDPTFGRDGKVTTTLGNRDEAINDIAIQDDGKIVAVGASWTNSSRLQGKLALARYRPDGRLDKSFAAKGTKTMRVGVSGELMAVAVQTDGNIVAVGYANSKLSTQLIVARYRPDGSLDLSFGEGGLVGASLAGVSFAAVANDVAIQSDGAIVVVGYLTAPNGGGFIARYLPDGTLDPSFSGDGVITGPASVYSAVALQPDARIIAGGKYQRSGQPDSDLALARFLPDGSPDLGYGDGGLVGVNLPPTPSTYPVSEVVDDIAFQGDGALVVYGFVSSFCLKCVSSQAFLSRHLEDGSLDPSFDGEGVVYPPEGAQGGSGLALQDDGKILIAQSERGPHRNLADFLVSRYEPTGTLDSSFGAGGSAFTDFKHEPDSPTSAAIQGTDLVVGGSYTRKSKGGAKQQHFALARYALGGP